MLQCFTIDCTLIALASLCVHTHHDWLSCVAALHISVWFVVFCSSHDRLHELIMFIMEIALHTRKTTQLHLISLFPAKNGIA